ncbi:hypothetical protein BH24ACT19_BH24ACT19_04440 [soil metagenome]
MVASRPAGVRDAVEYLHPETIGVIVSQEVLEDVVLVCLELRDRGVDFIYKLVDSPMEIEDAFEKFEHLLSELENIGYTRDIILLDPTGGTTPMRIGAALAAMTRGIEMVHQRVDQHRVAGRWEPIEGAKTEIVPMKNPLVATGLLREKQGVELFNRRDYGPAALVFGDIVEKVSGVERGHYYRGLLLLAEGYAAWDVADYGRALEKLKEARGELGVGFAEPALAERAGALVAGIAANLSFLGKVQGKLSIEKVVDMLENARRRILDQGRHDDGVARLYRTVEMWHQLRLQERHSVATDGPDWTKVPEDARRRFLGATGLAEPPLLLDLTRARTLDRILSGEVLEEDTVFRNLLQQRNRSILAHGLEPRNEKSAARFLEYVDAMVDAPEVRARAKHATLRGL